VKISDEARAVLRKQQYAPRAEIDGVRRVALRRFHDDGGSMIELLRLGREAEAGLAGFRPAQINFSTLEPGVVKAFHVHERQTDVWFVPPSDRVLIVLADVRAGSPTEGNRMRWVLGDADPSLVLIPPGVAHGCRNLGRDAATIVYLTDLHFSPAPDACDEGRLPWDLLGRDVWEIAWE
jgi:dTDP-4-dehydrorhamnose 3,5-epimerase